MSADSPSYSILLNGAEGADYFTYLETRRYVRSQLGSFQVHLDDDQFETWADLQRWQSFIASINGTRIFKGRIDKVVRHYDKKQDGFLTTVSGRDDSGALQDILFSKYYNLLRGSITTPAELLNDLITTVYPGRKGTLDPTLTLSTSTNFDAKTSNQAIFNWDRISFWQALEEVAAAIEGQYASEPFFLDFWTDENDVVHVTQTGELDLGIDVGGYGGDYIKTRDWTLDGLPIKNDIWFWGDTKAGRIPLRMDGSPNGWAAVHSVPAASPWTYETAQYYGQAISAGGSVLSGMTITDDAQHALIGSKSIHIHFDTWLLQGTSNSPAFFGWKMTMPFGPNTDDFKIFRRGPNGHLNFYNNDVMDETMGQISEIDFWLYEDINIVGTLTAAGLSVGLFLVDGTTPNPVGILSPRQTINPFSNASIYTVTSGGLSAQWQPFRFAVGPAAMSGLGRDVSLGVPAAFNWADVADIFFLIFPSSALGVTVGPSDLWFDGLQFVKPLVAQGLPAPTESVHSAIVTDTTVSNYQIASFRANQYRAALAEAQSYVDYLIVGRPDLQVGHTFTAEDEKVLIRESVTGATKLGGYVTSAKAWKPI